MNRRVNLIILDLVNKRQFPLKYYADFFHISEQTIRNDIKQLNEELGLIGTNGIYIDSSGKISVNAQKNVSDFLKAFSSIRDYRMTQEERRTVLAMLLLVAEDYVTTYYLADYVMVSRNTLLNDIESLKKWFSKKGLVLFPQTRLGYIVKGSEKKIRQAMIDLLILNNAFSASLEYGLENQNDIFQSLLLSIVDEQHRFEKIKEIILLSERKENLQLSDFSYLELSFYLLISLLRIERSKSYDQKEVSAQVEKSSKYPFALRVAGEISTAWGITLEQLELYQLTTEMRTKSYMINNARIIDSIEIQLLINEFMYAVSRSFHIHYYLNADLYTLLENHLKLLIYRTREENKISNPLLSEIYQTNKEIFMLVKEKLQPIEHYLGKPLSKDEISFLVMYVLAILEKNKTNAIQINAALVCNSGRATVQLLYQKIKNLFPQLNITSIISSHEAIKSRQEDAIDLYISTVPFHKKKAILVNAIPTEQDMANIQKEIILIQNKRERSTSSREAGTVPSEKQQNMYDDYIQMMENYMEESDFEKAEIDFSHSMSAYSQKYRTSFTEQQPVFEKLSDILAVNQIRLDVMVHDWQDAVVQAGKLLLKNKKIEKEYIDAMINTICEHDSYVVIYPGAAIPHALPAEGALELSASLVRVKGGVNFNHKINDPVFYVIAFSITENESIGKILYNLTEMLGTDKFIEYLNSAETEKEIMEKIKTFEHWVMRDNYGKKE